MPIDFARVRRELAEAARGAFGALREQHPEESFYAFALYTDGDGRGPSPAANSEQKYQRIVQRKGRTKESDLSLARWSTAEWAYEAEGCEHFHAAWALLNVEDADDPADADSRALYKARVFNAMVGALRDLDAEGFFGVGAARRGVTLFCSLSDSRDAVWLEQESARRLNPPEVYEAFEPQWRVAAEVQYGPRGFHYGALHKVFTDLEGTSR